MNTKITLFLLLFGVILSNTNAQLKHFLPNSNAVMSILDHKYCFEGDTIINSLRYTKVYRQKCETETECGELLYYAAVREDTIGEKMYAIYPCGSARPPYAPTLCDEVLLANFNVQAGDQVEVYCSWPEFWPTSKRPVTVESVDSIWIDNQYRKRINLVDYYGDHSPYGWPQDSWVEGIGSIAYGLFFSHPEMIADLGDSPKFLCLHLNGQILYRNPLYDTCFLRDSGTGIPFISPPEGKIYYSLANGQLQIHGNYTYKIYDARAFLVLSGINSPASINVSQWASGVYFIQLYDDKMLVYSGKFIKH